MPEGIPAILATTVVFVPGPSAIAVSKAIRVAENDVGIQRPEFEANPVFAYLGQRCWIGHLQDADVGTFIISPDASNDPLLVQLLTALVAGDGPEFVELMRAQGWLDA